MDSITQIYNVTGILIILGIGVFYVLIPIIIVFTLSSINKTTYQIKKGLEEQNKRIELLDARIEDIRIKK